jgi:glycerophosphoryl diester phosphodiesterase
MLRQFGLQFYVWTIDEVPLATQMIAANVSGITTNRCAWLRAQFP